MKCTNKEEFFNIVDILEEKGVVGILHFTIDNNILDSINKSMNSNYVGFMNAKPSDLFTGPGTEIIYCTDSHISLMLLSYYGSSSPQRPNESASEDVVKVTPDGRSRGKVLSQLAPLMAQSSAKRDCIRRQDSKNNSDDDYLPSDAEQDDDDLSYTSEEPRRKRKQPKTSSDKAKQKSKPAKCRTRRVYDVPEAERVYVREEDINWEVDVIPGRGGRTNNNKGNKACTAKCQELHLDHRNAHKKEKIHFTRQVIAHVQERGGRFLAFDEEKRTHYIMHGKMAEEKVCQKIRERAKRPKKKTW